MFERLLIRILVAIGLVRGRLPVEISTRGARFAEEASQSAELSDAAIRELRQTTRKLDVGLTAAKLEIGLMQKAIDDKTQQEVASP